MALFQELSYLLQLLQVKDLVSLGLCLQEGQGASDLIRGAGGKHPQSACAEWLLQGVKRSRDGQVKEKILDIRSGAEGK